MDDQLASVLLLTDSLNRENIVDKAAHFISQYSLGLIYLDIKNCSQMEQKCGKEACQKLLAAVKQIMTNLENEEPFGICAHRMFGDDLLVLIRMESGAGEAHLRCLAHNIYQRFKTSMAHQAKWAEPVDFHVGVSLLDSGAEKALEHLLYEAVKKAVSEAKKATNAEQQKLQTEFRHILAGQHLTAHYQPIVSLLDKKIYGYEALARGPQTSYFATPHRLWEFAEKENQLYALEKLARQKAIEGFSASDPNWKLFINLNANVIHDPQFTPGQTLAFLKKRGLTPQQVVFEITERQSIDDYASFKKVLSHYRKQGYRIAIDDAGAGYSSLQAIAELRPDYIKIDRSIIHKVDGHSVKAILLETLAGFARKIGCHLIAEGIETQEELQVVTKLGIPFGQGYWLGRPHPHLRPIAHETLRTWKLVDQPLAEDDPQTCPS